MDESLRADRGRTILCPRGGVYQGRAGAPPDIRGIG